MWLSALWSRDKLWRLINRLKVHSLKRRISSIALTRCFIVQVWRYLLECVPLCSLSILLFTFRLRNVMNVNMLIPRQAPRSQWQDTQPRDEQCDITPGSSAVLCVDIKSRGKLCVAGWCSHDAIRLGSMFAQSVLYWYYQGLGMQIGLW